MLTSVFATHGCSNIDDRDALGLVESSPQVLVGQISVCLVVCAFAVATALILLKIFDILAGIRVLPQNEIQGLDVTELRKAGYIRN